MVKEKELVKKYPKNAEKAFFIGTNKLLSQLLLQQSNAKKLIIV